MTTTATEAPRRDRLAPRLPGSTGPRPLDVDEEITRLMGVHGPDSPLAKALTAIKGETKDQAQQAKDAALATAIEEQRRAKRGVLWDAYASRRPAEYVDANLDGLHAQQDPEGRIRQWWQSGHRGLLLAGPPSKGKSWSAWSITNAIAADVRDGRMSPIEVLGIRVCDLAQELAPPDQHAARDEVAAARRARLEHQILGCDLLLLDDLLVRKPSDWWSQVMYRLFEHRSTACNTRTIITMNAPEKSGDDGPGARLETALGSAVTSRLQRDTVPAWVDGVDLRRTARWDPFAEF
jgi:DNA replication protein DnaC